MVLTENNEKKKENKKVKKRFFTKGNFYFQKQFPKERDKKKRQIKIQNGISKKKKRNVKKK